MIPNVLRAARIIVMLACLFCVSYHVAAAAVYADVDIEVLDADTGAPVQNASVMLVLGTPYLSRTDAHGSANIGDIPPGDYSLVVAATDYKAFSLAHLLIVGDTPHVTITVRLARTHLKTIGSVSVRATRYGVLRNDPLSGLPFELERPAVEDPFFIPRINGHDPSGMGAFLNGLSLNPQRFAPQLAGLDPDLVVSQDVTDLPANGFSAGSVDLRTILPTLYWKSALKEELNTYGGGAASVNVTGTEGFVGLAFQHSERWTNGPLNGISFADGSGLNYVHSQTQHKFGSLATVQGSVGSSRLMLNYLESGATADLVCTAISVSLPCGYGPGNTSASHFSIVDARISGIFSGADVSLEVVNAQSLSSQDFSRRVIQGTAQPSFSSSMQNNFSTNLELDRLFGENDVVSMSGAYSASKVSAGSLLGGQNIFSASTQQFFTLHLADRHDLGHQRFLIPAANFSSGGNYSDRTLQMVFQQRIGTADSLQFAIAGDRSSSTAGTLQFGLDPYALQFDCVAGAAHGQGPSYDPSGDQNSSALAISYAHDGRTGGFSLDAYAQNQQGLSIGVPVSATSFPASTFPANYFTVAQALYASSANCGSGSILNPANIFLDYQVPGIHSLYNGIKLNGYNRFGRHVYMQVAYNIASARDTSDNPLLANSTSTLISGKQIPNVPMHTGSMAIGYQNGSHFYGIVNTEFTSANNENNLPGYFLISVGASANVGSIRLTALMNNVFNAYAGSFLSPQFSVPLATNAGTPFATLAQPLVPRSYRLVATFDLGSAIGGRQAAAGNARSGLLDRMLGLGSAGIVPLNSRFMRNPLLLDVSRPSCVRSVRERLEPMLAGLRSAFEGLNRPTQPNVPRVGVSVDPLDPATLFLTPLDPEVELDLQVCSAIHFGNVQQAKRLNATVPPPSLTGGPALAVNERIGFYEILDPSAAPATNASYRYYPFGAPLPEDAFAVEHRCPAALQSAALGLLTDFRRAANSLPPFASTSQWTFHADRPDSDWVSAQPTVPENMAVLFECGHVTGLTNQDLLAAKLGGAPLPRINYAKSMGLYIVL